MVKWKYINYQGCNLCVSTDGRVIKDGKELNIGYNKDGYSVCSIKTHKGYRSARVARLVAIAFIPNPDNLPEVNHKDYDRANSRVDNLEWMSHADNVRYSNCNRPDYNGDKNPNYGNHKLSKIYAKDKNLSKEKQGRPGLKNGRCRKIKMFLGDELIKEFDYIVECCKYIEENYSKGSRLDSIRSQIDKSIRNNKTYKGFRFEKE